MLLLLFVVVVVRSGRNVPSIVHRHNGNAARQPPSAGNPAGTLCLRPAHRLAGAVWNARVDAGAPLRHQSLAGRPLLQPEAQDRTGLDVPVVPATEVRAGSRLVAKSQRNGHHRPPPQTNGRQLVHHPKTNWNVTVYSCLYLFITVYNCFKLFQAVSSCFKLFQAQWLEYGSD